MLELQPRHDSETVVLTISSPLLQAHAPLSNHNNIYLNNLLEFTMLQFQHEGLGAVKGST